MPRDADEIGESLPDWTAMLDQRMKDDGIEFLRRLPEAVSPLVFFDPQYRGVMDFLAYGNEGARQKERALLAQMPLDTIKSFLAEIERVLKPSGHLMLWVDKFHLVEGIAPWHEGLILEPVDLMTWDKGLLGMGHRTRRVGEYLVIFQKPPRKAKGIWTIRNIRDVWPEKAKTRKKGAHPHTKPDQLQTTLIMATTKPDDIVLDPAAGSFSVMAAAHAAGRRFLGCDIRG